MVRGEVCWLVLRWVSSVLSFRGRLVGLSWPAVDVAHGGGFRGRLVCWGLGGFPLPVPVCNRERAKDLARLDGCLPQVSESMCGGV